MGAMSLDLLVEEIDDIEEVVQRYAYSAFGKILSIQDKNGNDVTAAPPVDQLYSYMGKECDSEIEKCNFITRTYDPFTGRFMQQDTIGFAGGDANLYRFVGNNSISRIDPYGLFEITFAAGGTAGVGGFAGLETAVSLGTSKAGGFGASVEPIVSSGTILGGAAGLGTSITITRGDVEDLGSKSNVSGFTAGPFSVGIVSDGDGFAGIQLGFAKSIGFGAFDLDSQRNTGKISCP